MAITTILINDGDNTARITIKPFSFLVEYAKPAEQVEKPRAGSVQHMVQVISRACDEALKDKAKGHTVQLPLAQYGTHPSEPTNPTT